MLPEQLPLRLGTAPVNWNNFDLTDWRPRVPYPAILDEVRIAGYSATEWDISFGSNVEVLSREASQRDITYMGAYRWLDFLHDDAYAIDVAELTSFLDVLVGIGVNHLIVADRLRPERVAIAGAVPNDGSRSLDPSEFKTIARNLKHLAEQTAPLGIKVHYHNHAGTWVEAPAEVEMLTSLLSETPVDLCFDTGHFAYGGGDAHAFLVDHLDAIGYLHLKDVDSNVLTQAKRHGWSFLDALRHIIFCPLGQGDANIASIVKHLVRKDFSGWVIVEQDTCAGDSTDNARGNRETILSLAHQAILAKEKGL